jgi:type IV secretion system protein VirB10
MIALGILVVIMGTIAYTYRLRMLANSGTKSGQTGTVIGVLTSAPEAGFIPPKAASNIPVLDTETPHRRPEPAVSEAAKPNPYQGAWENYLKRLDQLRQAREQVALAALDATTTISAGSQKGVSAAPVNPAAAPSSLTEQFTKYAADRLNQLGNGGEADLNRQSDKRAFIAEREPRTSLQNTLNASREAPVSAFEVRSGTVIPAVMIGGVNSDLPGQLIAQVSNNVYDTATGRHIVIPQGSKLIGVYDSSVTTGQERVLVAWTRIIFPDASAIDLGRMPGADEGGYGGFHDRVNDHFWKVWSNALLLSAFSAGVQLSQGNGNNQANGLTSQQTVAASLGQQMGQLGMEIARRNLQIQPTLEIRPGYRFLVQVTKDMILRPWAPKDRPRFFFGGYAYRGGVQMP